MGIALRIEVSIHSKIRMDADNLYETVHATITRGQIIHRSSCLYRNIAEAKDANSSFRAASGLQDVHAASVSLLEVEGASIGRWQA